MVVSAARRCPPPTTATQPMTPASAPTTATQPMTTTSPPHLAGATTIRPPHLARATLDQQIRVVLQDGWDPDIMGPLGASISASDLILKRAGRDGYGLCLCAPCGHVFGWTRWMESGEGELNVLVASIRRAQRNIRTATQQLGLRHGSLRLLCVVGPKLYIDRHGLEYETGRSVRSIVDRISMHM